MNAPIASLYFVSAGMLLMGSFQAALMARSSDHVKAAWLFSAICLAFSLFQVSNAAQYTAGDLPAAVDAHKWVNLFLLLIVALIWYLVASFDDAWYAPVMSHGIAVLIGLVIACNFASPLGFRFSSVHPDTVVVLPWGERIAVLSGEPSAVSRVVRAVSLALMVYALLFSVRVHRLGARLASALIWGSVGLMFLTTGVASLSDAGTLKMPYLGGFGFLFLAASFSIMIRTNFSNRKLEQVRISSALVQEVERHEIAKQRFQHALNNDPLTGLPNRSGALARLRILVDLNGLNRTVLAVFLLDVDRLGIINGTRGHQVGDQVLVEVSERLLHNVTDSDLVARLTNGGFLVAAGNLVSDGGVAVLYDKLAAALEAPFLVAGSALRITASAGVAVFPDDAGAAEDVLAAAELALHDAKRSGPGSLGVYRPSMKGNIQERIDFENDLKEALMKRQFFLCYQPQVRASDGRTVCMEALIRWQHPTHGLVLPDRFIQLAESMGLIAAIGSWVIESACEQLARWHRMGYDGLRVAVNLSAQQLLVSNLEESVAQAIRRFNLKAADVELEITESVLMQDPESSIARLGALKSLGVRLSIDDFGTGYSSLSYLKVLPVHAFKLDRSFVRDIGKGGKDLEICATAIGLARNLGLDIVAEGVETEAQARRLRALGSHLLQGYFFARPLVVAAANEFLGGPFKSLETGAIPLEFVG